MSPSATYTVELVYQHGPGGHKHTIEAYIGAPDALSAIARAVAEMDNLPDQQWLIEARASRDLEGF